MGTHVSLSSIITDRVLEDDDDIGALAKDIKSNGLMMPILINQSGQLIDGLRRLEAVRSLGWDEVEVDAKLLYPQACSHIKATREHGVMARELSPQRIWDIYKMILPLMNITRAHLQRGKRKGQGPGPVGGRYLILDALGLKSESWLQALTQVYRAAESDPTERGDLAREARDGIENGTMTIYMGAEHMRKPKRLTGDITKLDEQRAALRTATSSLAGIARGLDQLGPIHPDFDRKEIEERLTQMRDFRRTYARIIHLIEEEINPS